MYLHLHDSKKPHNLQDELILKPKNLIMSQNSVIQASFKIQNVRHPPSRLYFFRWKQVKYLKEAIECGGANTENRSFPVIRNNNDM